MSCTSVRVRPDVGDGGPAIHAMINGPAGLAFVGRTLYVAELTGQIRRIDLATGIITTLKTSRRLDATFSLCADSLGRLLVIDVSKVSAIDPRDGQVSPFAGTELPGTTGDGGPATAARVHIPLGCSADSQGNVFIADSAAKRVRRIDAQSGVISTFAGSGLNETSGDGNLAVNAGFEFPNSVAVDEAGNVYIAQGGYDSSSYRIRRVDHATGIVTTIAGPDSTVWLSRTERRTGIPSPMDVVYDRKGNLLFDGDERVFRLDLATGEVHAVGGGGSSTKDGPALAVRLATPSALAVASDGAVIVCEYVGNRVRRIDMTSGQITTIGGNGKPKRVDIIM